MTLSIISLEFEYDYNEALFQCVFDATYQGIHFGLVISFVAKKFIAYLWHVLLMETPSKLYLGHPRGWGGAPWLLENVDIS